MEQCSTIAVKFRVYIVQMCNHIFLSLKNTRVVAKGERGKEKRVEFESHVLQIQGGTARFQML